MSKLKKGTANNFRRKKVLKADMQQEMRTKYLEEVRAQLLSAEYAAEFRDDRTLQIKLDGKPLCQVCDTGNLRYFEEDAVGREKALDQVRDIASTTREYMSLLDRAPPLTADGLEDGYNLLAEFNGTVLAGYLTGYGAQFVTWEWVHDRTSLWQGHFYGPGDGAKNYDAAKRDLRFEDPLMVIRDQWILEQSIDLSEEFDHVLWYLKDSGVAEQGYPLVPDDSLKCFGPTMC